MVLSTRARGALASKAAKREPVASRASSPSAALGSACALPTCLVPASAAPQRLLFAHLLLSYRGASGQARLAAAGSSKEERTGSGEMSEGAAGGQPGSEQTASVDVDHNGAEMPPNEVNQV